MTDEDTSRETLPTPARAHARRAPDREAFRIGQAVLRAGLTNEDLGLAVVPRPLRNQCNSPVARGQPSVVADTIGPELRSEVKALAELVDGGATPVMTRSAPP